MSEDLIKRSDAINALETIGYDFSDSELSAVELEELCEAVGDVRQDMINRIRRMSSAQPDRLTDDDFETIRIHLNAYKEKLCNQQRWKEAEEYQRIIDRFTAFASVHSERQNRRIFQEIIVEYPSISTYPEYEGKPYFSIKYMEDGQEFIGYGTYKPEVLSEYLKEYFMTSAASEIIRCKDCKHNPKESWFECPMAHCSEKQRPETAWCWKGERKDDETD